MSESTEFSETIGDSEESSTAGSSKGSRRGRQRKEVVEDSESAVNQLTKDATLCFFLSVICLSVSTAYLFTCICGSDAIGTCQKTLHCHSCLARRLRKLQ